MSIKWTGFHLSLTVKPLCIIAKSCGTNTHTTHATAHDPDQNIGGRCYPKCKQIQSLVTVVCAIHVFKVWLIIVIYPDVSTNKPNKQEAVQDSLKRPFPLFLAVFLIVILLGPMTQWDEVSEHTYSPSDNQVDRNLVLYWALVLVFSSCKINLGRPSV